MWHFWVEISGIDFEEISQLILILFIDSQRWCYVESSWISKLGRLVISIFLTLRVRDFTNVYLKFY